MDVREIVAMWPQADAGKRYAWAQQVRFDATLSDEDVPHLVELYRVVLDEGGDVQRPMEEALLTALARIGSAAALPIFREVLFSRPPRGASPLAEVVETLADIAGHTSDKQGLALLEECLRHEDVDVRDMATTAIVRAYRMAGYPIPQRVIRQLYQLLQRDDARRVRFSAGLALQDAGELNLAEVIFWAEDMAGWEEDPTWSIDDNVL